ncbi:putative phosphorylated adapter RNA export RNA-binding protein [Lupinus albus]|uniref:Phosphorylated adapter RNA export protein n=1 Tax=Lupinus albus TaxID=3870 RepID=A0A6A4NI28_LUPAL|nr:putative phosphorylated adapter RNA export RNA-binding protein [Lupinus albus]
MEDEENILESILDEDVDMIDIEEGELVENNDSLQISAVVERGDDININELDKESDTKNRKRRVNKKKNKKKRKGSGPNAAINIDRFVLDTCRRLKEKKSYMVYTAIGCLGLSALSDIIKEVDAIQACGGQKTADDRRFRTGGGVLWNIIKVREPQAYKEIMKKAKEFEKQFRHPNVKQPPMQKKDDDSPGVAFTLLGGNEGNASDSSLPKSHQQDQRELSDSEEKRISVRDRLRIPVSYDDDLLGSNADNNAN